MMKLGVLLVHGIGIQDPEWAEGIIRALRDAVSQAAARLLPGRPAPPADAMVECEPVYWEEILREREQALQALLEAARAPGPSAVGWLRRAIRWLRRKESRFVADYIGDIIGYLNPEARLEIQQEFAAGLERLAARLPSGGGKRPLTIIAHSLGTVIGSEYIWDHGKARAAQRQDGFDPAWRFENFFTVGSPLALFSLKFGGPEAFKQPIAVEPAHGRWVNLFDEDDPVGMPLRPLNDAYAQAVLADVQVESGIYLLAHHHYFTCRQVLEAVSRKLALDWALLNQQLPQDQAAAQYARYDEWVARLHA